VDSKVPGVMPCCQGITYHNNSGRPGRWSLSPYKQEASLYSSVLKGDIPPNKTPIPQGYYKAELSWLVWQAK